MQNLGLTKSSRFFKNPHYYEQVKNDKPLAFNGQGCSALLLNFVADGFFFTPKLYKNTASG